jgi:molybdopterin molybdotransferase
MVNYELFVKSILLKLSGASASYPGVVKTKIGKEHKLKPGRHTAVLGNFDGSSFTPLPQQSPGMVSPLQKADGLIITQPDTTLLKEGHSVSMLPIRWHLSSIKKVDIFTK